MKSAINIISNSLKESKKSEISFCENPQTVDNLLSASLLIATAIRNGKKVISCGNGGSCCDAMHFAEELTGRFRHNRNPFPALAISDPAHLTCVANDFGYENVFSRYVDAVGSKDDVLLGISTSGKSFNVLKAAEIAKSRGMKIIVLTGNLSTPLSKMADVSIHTPESKYSDRIQELHIKSIHIIIETVEYLLKTENDF